MQLTGAANSDIRIGILSTRFGLHRRFDSTCERFKDVTINEAQREGFEIEPSDRTSIYI